MDGARTYAPSGYAASTFGAATFHDPVRDGSGWVPRALHTPLVQEPSADLVVPLAARLRLFPPASLRFAGKPSPVRVARLNSLPSVQLRPLLPVFFRGAYLPEAVSVLILGGRSHLDAFSGSDLRP